MIYFKFTKTHSWTVLPRPISSASIPPLLFWIRFHNHVTPSFWCTFNLSQIYRGIFKPKSSFVSFISGFSWQNSSTRFLNCLIEGILSSIFSAGRPKFEEFFRLTPARRLTKSSSASQSSLISRMWICF